MNCYDLLAAEYYDASAHPTCSNFLELSRLYISEQIRSKPEGGRILEVGAGDSAVAQIFHRLRKSLSRLEITDLSEEMLVYSYRWRRYGAKVYAAHAASLPHPDHSVDLIVASLADPYNTPQLWGCFARVLSASGQIILTTPSYEWAVRYRSHQTQAKDFSQAEFILRDGGKTHVPSFIYPLGETIAMIEAAGLSVMNHQSLGIDHLST